jgi:hypothetical protein
MEVQICTVEGYSGYDANIFDDKINSGKFLIFIITEFFTHENEYSELNEITFCQYFCQLAYHSIFCFSYFTKSELLKY